MKTWINHSSKTFKYVLYNPSWKDILELQRKLGNNMNELGIILFDMPVNNVPDMSKMNSINIFVWYGFNKCNSNILFKHIDKQFEKYKEDIYLV